MGKTHEALRRAEAKAAEQSKALELLDFPFSHSSEDAAGEPQAAPLRAALMTRYSHSELGSIAFVGATEGDGVSTLSKAFAAGLANGGASRVALVEADFRRSRFDSAVKSVGPTLADLLQGHKTALDALSRYAGSLLMVPPGEPSRDPLALLQNGGMSRLLTAMRQHFDHIVIDCPPPLQYPETLMMARETDGFVLVIRAGTTRKTVAKRTLQMLEQSGARAMGTVLNRRRHYIPNWLYRLL